MVSSIAQHQARPDASTSVTVKANPEKNEQQLSSSSAVAKGTARQPLSAAENATPTPKRCPLFAPPLTHPPQAPSHTPPPPPHLLITCSLRMESSAISSKSVDTGGTECASAQAGGTCLSLKPVEMGGRAAAQPSGGKSDRSSRKRSVLLPTSVSPRLGDSPSAGLAPITVWYGGKAR
ncbi:hypothetical protein D9619_013377 [Psilocybe cf. subviscida]|uniref:Uncharacterized protein n=1 Tax=Psilocybe cf. subviscida TaxID=2480587 RepID=A0A8H5F9L6_9AGAR|nr:hypothetical protein D9619_013377 [Psilocybe cf. subviscida]